MSTKSLEAVLRHLRNGTRPDGDVVAMATDDLSAIRKAAKAVTTEGGDWGNPDAPAWDTLRAIAKEET